MVSRAKRARAPIDPTQSAFRRLSPPGWFLCPGNICKRKSKGKFPRGESHLALRALWRCSYPDVYKCVIMKVPRLLFFPNLSVYLRGCQVHTCDYLPFGNGDICE